MGAALFYGVLEQLTPKLARTKTEYAAKRAERMTNFDFATGHAVVFYGLSQINARPHSIWDTSADQL
jgi:hypothetical protein